MLYLLRGSQLYWAATAAARQSRKRADGRSESASAIHYSSFPSHLLVDSQPVGRSIGGLGSYGRQAEVGSLTFQFASAIIDHNLIITGRLSSRFGSSSSQTSQNSGDICRICHCESEPGNPLLTPCYCSGSLKYVHQSCLQQWLTASETNSCELCKFPFIMHTKIKPFNEVRSLSGGFHCPSD